MATGVAINVSVTGTEQAQKQVLKLADGIDQVGTRSASAATESASLSAALGKVAHYGLAGGSIYAMVNTFMDVGGALLEASTQAQRLATQLNFATNGNGAREMAWVSGLANTLGLELNSTAKAFAGFASAARGTALEGAAARDVFEAMAKASAVMGLSTQETSGALLAVQQMMSKGVVSAEEFRGQLGERMPIALQAGAQALGVTTAEFSKLLETGQIVAQDFLPKFATAITTMLGDSVEQAADRMDAATARMGNAWEKLKQTVGNSGISQGIANEMTAMGNYMTALADSMDNAKASGAGFFGQMNAGAANILGRMPFDVLALSANTLNTGLNALTGGALGLRTDLNLLPGVFDTNAARAQALGGQLKAAEGQLAELSAKLQQVPDNIYLKSETYQAYLLVQQLRAAKAAQSDLAGAGGGRGSVNPQTVGQMDAARAADRAAFDKGGEAYLGKDQKNQALLAAEIDKTRALFERGSISAAEYAQRINAVQASFVKATPSVKEHTAAQDQAAKGMALYNDLLVKADGFNANFAEQVVSLSKAKLSTEEYSKAVGLLLKQQPGMVAAAKAEADALKATNKARDDAIAGQDKATQSAQDALEKQLEHNTTIGLSTTALAELATANLELQAVELERKARLQDGIMWDANITDGYLAEAKALRELAAAKVTGAQRQVSADAAKDMLADQKKAAEESGKWWEEKLMDAFTAGLDGWSALWNTIKNTLKTQVLKVLVQGTMTATGMGSYANAAAGTDPAAGGLSSLSSLSNLGSSLGGSLLASNAAYGAAIGTSSIGAGSQAAMLAAQTGEFGAAGLSATAGAAGGAPAMMAAAAPYLAAAVAVYFAYKAFKKDKTPTVGTGEGSISYAADGTISSEDTGRAGNGGLNTGTRAAITGMQAGYESAAKAFGIETLAAQWSFGGNTGKDSKGNNFALGVNIGDKSYTSGEQAVSPEALNLHASRAIATALTASELPHYLSGLFDDITISTASQQQLDAVMAYGTALAGLNRGLMAMPEHFQSVAALSFEATESLIGFAGGIEALQSNLGTYYQNFYTAEEQRAQQIMAINAATAGSGLDAATATREDFRRIVEAQDLTTESGRKMYASLIGVSGAFAQISQSAQDLIAGISAKVGNSLFDMQYGMADNRGKYNMIDVQAAKLNEQMLGSTDINVIAKMAADQIDLINKSWALLTPEQQRASYSKFETKLEAIDTFVQTKGADPAGVKAASDKATADAIAVAVEAAVAKAMVSSAAAMQAAADKADKPVVVETHVTVSAPAGSEVSIGNSNR